MESLNDIYTLEKGDDTMEYHHRWDAGIFGNGIMVSSMLPLSIRCKDEETRYVIFRAGTNRNHLGNQQLLADKSRTYVCDITDHNHFSPDTTSFRNNRSPILINTKITLIMVFTGVAKTSKIASSYIF